MKPGWIFAGGAATTIAVLLVVLLVVDQFVRPLPAFRKYRNKAAVAAAVFLTGGLYLLLRKKKDGPDPDSTPTVPPRSFDDAPERQTDADADDTDLSVEKTDRDVAGLDRRADERDERLAELRERASTPGSNEPET